MAGCITQSLSYANDIDLVGTVQHRLPQPVFNGLRATAPTSIALLKVDLSEHARKILNRNIYNSQKPKLGFNVANQYPMQVQLGMSQVPVLNQGTHGTCVTFAATAALDAALNKGDYISQLCALQLGQYLEKNAYQASGWDGSWGRNVLWQMSVFGLINKTQQRANACGSLTEYPLVGNVPDQYLSPDIYHGLSEPFSQHLLAWSSLLDDYQVSFDKVTPVNTLNALKNSLAAGDRVTFGVLLLNIDQGIIGAVGSHNTANDTWVLTQEMVNEFSDKTELVGHEMVLTGYDDQATAKDKKGRIYRGLFTLRNSWGPQIGDHGDFYMTYDYLSNLIIEAQRIRSLRTDP